MQKNDSHMIPGRTEWSPDYHKRVLPNKAIDRKWNEYHRGPRTGNRLLRNQMALAFLGLFKPETILSYETRSMYDLEQRVRRIRQSR